MTTQKERGGLLALVLAFAAVGVGHGQVTYVGVPPTNDRTLRGSSSRTTLQAMSILFGTLAVLGLIDHHVHAYTGNTPSPTVFDGPRISWNMSPLPCLEQLTASHSVYCS